MPRPEGSPDALEMRRKLAVRLLEYGLSGQEVAEAFGVSPGSVSRWKQAYEAEGEAGLEADPHPGRERVLDDDQLLDLADCLRRGPAAYGFEAGRWTRGRVAEVIEAEFGESVSGPTAYRYLRRMGWESAPPDIEGAGGREQADIEEWRRRQYERVQERLGGADAAEGTGGSDEK